MEENKNQFKIGDLITGTNCHDKRVDGEIVGFAETTNLPLVSSELSPTTVVWNAVLMSKQAPKLTDISDRANEYGNRLMLGQKNEVCQNCGVIKPGHKIMVNNLHEKICLSCKRPLAFQEGATYVDQMTATLWVMLEQVKEEAPRARQYLKLTGATMVPDKVKEILHLKTSASTLGRKFRASATGDNPQLKRILIENNEGRMVVHYLWNPDYKEGK